MSAPTMTTAVAGAAAGLWHAAPALTSIGPLRRPFPRLSGQGRPSGIELTFDDGPDPLGTPAVLAELDRLGWTATFFMLGSQVRAHPDVARSVVAAGHEIAVHGDLHRVHLLRTAAQVRADLARALGDIRALTGTDPRWFRPPYGVFTSGSLTAARTLGLNPVLWTAWGRDWQKANPGWVLNNVMSGLADGGTLLLHDSDCTSTPRSWRTTARTLSLLAERLDEQGLQVRPLRDHLTAA
ncbi:polysaccharide deacetylase family protein [Klenkia sp. LSe6-5]|uniref:Polysaccharide deacetylase family protein n=1 Tax=Klenkia sesuvii TaxID=3103137 RepID=A0ABU8DVS8_9ACTN